MIPCSRCLNADCGYDVHCGHCSCCDRLHFNWYLVGAYAASGLALFVAYEFVKEVVQWLK